MPTRRIIGVVLASLALLALACDDQARSPQEGFVVQNDTDRPIYVVVGAAVEEPVESFARRRNFSPAIAPGDSFRERYSVSLNDEPGGCLPNIQFYAVHVPDSRVDDARIADAIDPTGIEIVKHWPVTTCFAVDDQKEVVTG